MQHTGIGRKLVLRKYSSETPEKTSVDDSNDLSYLEIPLDARCQSETVKTEPHIESSETPKSEHMDEVVDVDDLGVPEGGDWNCPDRSTTPPLILDAKALQYENAAAFRDVELYTNRTKDTGPDTQQDLHDNIDPSSDLRHLSTYKALMPPRRKDEPALSTASSKEANLENEWVDDETDQGDSALHYTDSSVAKHATKMIRNQLDVDRAVSRTIHILGSGSIGKFIAHSLATVPNAPPVTLLLHSHFLRQQWEGEGGAIRLIKNGAIEPQSGFKIESSLIPENEMIGPLRDLSQNSQTAQDSTIDNLIVATEGNITISALSAIKHRLRPTSTICFIQEGLGMAELVNSSVFPKPATRPSYMLGTVSHDIHATENHFTIIERRSGTVSLTILPVKEGMEGRVLHIKGAPSIRRVGEFGWTPQTRYLMRTLTRVPALHAKGMIRAEFFKVQFEKLAINSVLGPLSVVFNCTNDRFLFNYHIMRTMKMLLKEISLVLQSLPEVSRNPTIVKNFTAQKLEAIVLSVIGKTGANRTSMLQAVMNGKKTDIDFYNGYLLDRAAELGLDCPCMEMLVSIVKGKAALRSREMNSVIPFSDAY